MNKGTEAKILWYYLKSGFLLAICRCKLSFYFRLDDSWLAPPEQSKGNSGLLCYVKLKDRGIFNKKGSMNL